jgi:hypothetical protein
MPDVTNIASLAAIRAQRFLGLRGQDLRIMQCRRPVLLSRMAPEYVVHIRDVLVALDHSTDWPMSLAVHTLILDPVKALPSREVLLRCECWFDPTPSSGRWGTWLGEQQFQAKAVMQGMRIEASFLAMTNSMPTTLSQPEGPEDDHAA